MKLIKHFARCISDLKEMNTIHWRSCSSRKTLLREEQVIVPIHINVGSRLLKVKVLSFSEGINVVYSWHRIFLEKLTVSHLVKKFHAFVEN
jgi:hypothetical protein